MQIRNSSVAAITTLGLALFLAREAFAAGALPRSSPEAQGVSSADVLAFVKAADERIEGMHSLMIVRRGHVVAEGWWTPYDAAGRHSLYSLTKSFTSTAVGLAISDGKLSLDDSVLSMFPDEAPAQPSDSLKAMRVRDLLSMSTGHHDEAPFRAESNWVRSFLAHPVAHKPGTLFLYNTPASNTLASIVQKAVGTGLLDYLRPRLFDPLGIEDPQWSLNPQGVPTGGFGMSLRTEDIARFGQLYLQKGQWQGRQLVPAAWVEAATSRQVSNGSKPDSDWEQGYGYQFWRCRNGAYRGDGAFGQYCVVLPKQETVVAITSGVKSMQAVLDVLWEKLLPALSADALPENAAAQQQLQAALKGLTLAMPKAAAAPALKPQVTGRRYAFPANDQKLEWISLERSGDAATLVAKINGVEQRLALGNGEWRRGNFSHAAQAASVSVLREAGKQSLPPVAASGAWTARDTYTAKIAFYETPFALTLSLRFGGDMVVVDSEYNVAFGATKQPPLVGTAEPAK
jgi:CubicO group peptidase (beta-lactamase class C family)